MLSKQTYLAAGLLCVLIFAGALAWLLVRTALPGADSVAAAVVTPEMRFSQLSDLAQKGDPIAQYKLARMYRYGDGTSQNNSESWLWLERAAERGNSDAQFEMAMVMRDGKGVVQDFERGLAWLKSAAEGGNPEAQHELGLMYFSGQGIQQDNTKAYVWLNLAAAGGVTTAARSRDAVMRLLSPSEVLQAQTQARHWGEKVRVPQTAQ